MASSPEEKPTGKPGDKEGPEATVVPGKRAPGAGPAAAGAGPAAPGTGPAAPGGGVGKSLPTGHTDTIRGAVAAGPPAAPAGKSAPTGHTDTIHGPTPPLGAPGGGATGAPGGAPGSRVDVLDPAKTMMLTPSGEAAKPGAPAAGELLLGRYQVVKVLGRGAMGEVLEVVDKQSGNHYALKRLPPEVARDEEQMTGVRENFALVSQLTHPHIATTRYLENDPATNQAYLIMDLVRGYDLTEWVVEQREQAGGPTAPLAMEKVLGVAEQIASALDYAHSQPVAVDAAGKPTKYGILHRDMKPANVMADPQREYRTGVPFVRLVDFGLAAEIQASMQSASLVRKETNVAGTPSYMAPEQWEARTLTRGVDQWGLAVIIYEMLGGRKPFEAPSIAALATQVSRAQPSPPPGLSDAQWEALRVSFNLDRRKRHRSCMALVKALAAASRLTEDSIVAAEMPMPDEFTGVVMIAPPKRARAFRPARLVVAAAFLAAVGLVLVLWARGGRTPAPERDAGADIAAVMAVAGGAEEATGEKLDDAIGSLEQLKQRWASRPPEELKPATELLQRLTARRLVLTSRQRDIENLLTAATGLMGTAPAEALGKLEEAQRLAQADLKKVWPDLMPQFGARIKQLAEDVNKTIGRTQEQQARRAFRDEYDLGREAYQNKDWAAARDHFQAALGKLGSYQDPMRGDAEKKLGEAKAELQKRADFAAQRKAADELLAAGKFAEAKEAYTAALALWPETPDRGSLEQAIGKAGAELQALAHEALLAQGREAVKQKQWAAALDAFQKVKDAKYKEADAAAGIGEARYGLAMDKAQAAVAGQQWAEAETAYQEALAHKPGDATATQGVANVKARAAEARFQASVKAGQAALTAKEYARAKEAFSAALQAKPDAPEAVAGLSAAEAGLSAGEFDAILKKVQADLKDEKTDAATGTYTGIGQAKLKEVQAALDRALSLQPADPTAKAIKAKLGNPPELSLDLGGSQKLDLVLVTPGQFAMGSRDGQPFEQPAHAVQITQPYYLGKFPVTVAQFRRFAERKNYQTEAEKAGQAVGLKEGKWTIVPGINWRNPGFTQTAGEPVVLVTWNDAQAFLKWVQDETGRAVRLPTEAEWEYAARGSQGSTYPWGDALLEARLNDADAALKATGKASRDLPYATENDGYAFTSPVGQFRNGSWCGALDMAGNVWQWCQDWYGAKYYAESERKDPPGPAGGNERCVRGGAWSNGAADCRSFVRDKATPDTACDFTGFRVLMPVGGKAP